jgi:hypothetical protein
MRHIRVADGRLMFVKTLTTSTLCLAQAHSGMQSNTNHSPQTWPVARDCCVFSDRREMKSRTSCRDYSGTNAVSAEAVGVLQRVCAFAANSARMIGGLSKTSVPA